MTRQDHLENESFVLNGNRLSLSEETQNLIGLKVQKSIQKSMRLIGNFLE